MSDSERPSISAGNIAVEAGICITGAGITGAVLGALMGLGASGIGITSLVAIFYIGVPWIFLQITRWFARSLGCTEGLAAWMGAFTSLMGALACCTLIPWMDAPLVISAGIGCIAWGIALLVHWAASLAI